MRPPYLRANGPIKAYLEAWPAAWHEQKAAEEIAACKYLDNMTSGKTSMYVDNRPDYETRECKKRLAQKS